MSLESYQQTIVMNKNLVVITSMQGLVDNSCEQYCVNTWQYWCDKNNADLIILDQPIADTHVMKPTWQRWYIWDILENSNLDYEKVALVDVDTMVRWDAPNFFDLVNNEIGVCSDNDNIGWVKQSIDGYQHLFSDTELDWTEYFNCGFVVMDKSEKRLCDSIKMLWTSKQSQLIELQAKVRKGTDQTPVNFLAKEQKIKVNFLSKKFNLTHLNRKEILNNFMFVDCGYVWHFNGFDKSARTPLMMQTWEKIKSNYEN